MTNIEVLIRTRSNTRNIVFEYVYYFERSNENIITEKKLLIDVEGEMERDLLKMDEISISPNFLFWSLSSEGTEYKNSLKEKIV